MKYAKQMNKLGIALILTAASTFSAFAADPGMADMKGMGNQSMQGMDGMKNMNDTKGADMAKDMAESLTANQMYLHNLKLTSVLTSLQLIIILMCMPSSPLLRGTNYTSTRNVRRSKHPVVEHQLTLTPTALDSPRWSPKWTASNMTSTTVTILTDAVSNFLMKTLMMTTSFQSNC